MQISVDHARELFHKITYQRRTKYSLVAQLVEQAAVNRPVAGSSPAQGAIF